MQKYANQEAFAIPPALYPLFLSGKAVGTVLGRHSIQYLIESKSTT